MLRLNHKNLDVYKKGTDLVTEVYQLTRSFPKEEQFGLTSQLRRASISIISNLAEGSARKSSLERKRFYEISRSSLVEVDAQLEIAIKLNFLSQSDNEEVFVLIEEVFKMLSSLISNT
ncbi:MAG: four helix bundle protein [Bacteroidetes bacterium]|nr:four helix bundle protein [Bacteroidota bacterium]